MSSNCLDLLPCDGEIKAAFFDIDGTLLKSDGNYSLATLVQLERVRKLGVKTAAATGRPHYGAKFLQKDLSIIDAGVYFSGALVYRPATGETLMESSIEPDSVHAMLEVLRSNDIYYEIYGKQDYCVDHKRVPLLTQTHAQHLRCVPANTDAIEWLQSQSVFKFILGADQHQSPHLLDEIEQQFPQLIFAYSQFPAFPNWRFANVISGNASKHKAFDLLLDYYRISSENVVSFGDSQSDEVFLSRAGYGVAMGNASERVKAVARYVTTNADDDGVAEALRRMIP